MGRKANRGDELVELIPTSDGNAEDSAPVKLIFRKPTERQKRSLFLEAPQDESNTTKAVEFQDSVILTTLVKVENWEGIENGQDFVQFAELEFYTEAATFALKLLGLSETEAKNSKGSSGSTGRTTQAPDGSTVQRPTSAGAGAVVSEM